METAIAGECGTQVTDLDRFSGHGPGSDCSRTSVAASRHRHRLLLAVKIAASGLIIALAVARFAALDAAALWGLLSGAGWSISLVLLPPLCALAADTAGLAACLPARFSARLLFQVLPARIGCDALGSALPGGVAMAETVRPVTLARSLKTNIEQCVAACLMGKVNMAASQALFLATIGCFLMRNGDSARIVNGLPLGEHAGLLATGCLGGLIALLVFFYSGPRCTQIHDLLRRIDRPRWRAFLTRHANSLHAVDAHVRRFSRENVRGFAGSIGGFSAGWVCAGLESYVILAVLGADVSVLEGLTLECIASLLRISFFFLPSALGVAEVSYASLIAAFGIGDPLTVAAAFITLKRAREALWVSGGLLLLLRGGGAASTRLAHPCRPDG